MASTSRFGKDVTRWTGIKEAQRDIQKLAKRLDTKSLKKIGLDAARLIYDEARRIAPYDENRTKGTHVRDAIFIGEGDPSKPDVLVGVNGKKAPHAHLLEFGWSLKHEGIPFMHPAAKRTRGERERIIISGVKELVEKK